MGRPVERPCLVQRSIVDSHTTTTRLLSGPGLNRVDLRERAGTRSPRADRAARDPPLASSALSRSTTHLPKVGSSLGGGGSNLHGSSERRRCLVRASLGGLPVPESRGHRHPSASTRRWAGGGADRPTTRATRAPAPAAPVWTSQSRRPTPVTRREIPEPLGRPVIVTAQPTMAASAAVVARPPECQHAGWRSASCFTEVNVRDYPHIASRERAVSRFDHRCSSRCSPRRAQFTLQSRHRDGRVGLRGGVLVTLHRRDLVAESRIDQRAIAR